MARTCNHCGVSLVGTYQRVVCKAPACVDKQAEVRREAMKKAEAIRRKAERERNAEADPRFCDHCGKQMTGVDNRRLPVCSRDACLTWWKTERVVSRKKSMAEASKRSSWENRAHHSAPVEIYYNLSDDDYTHQKYVKQQAEIRANGRICKKDRCNRKTDGVNYYCDRHHKDINLKAASGNFGGVWGGGGDTQRRAFSGVM